jgi:hypothetical protein
MKKAKKRKIYSSKQKTKNFHTQLSFFSAKSRHLLAEHYSLASSIELSAFGAGKQY